MHFENKKNARRREAQQKSMYDDFDVDPYSYILPEDGMKAASRQRSASNAKKPPDGLPSP